MYGYMEEAEKAAEEIARLYLKASRYLSEQSDQIFEKYQTKYGLSENEARKLLSELKDKTSLDEILEKLKNCSSGMSRKELLKQLEAPAYQARLERLRQLQNQIDIVMTQVYHQEKQKSTSFYTDLANESYYKSIFNIQQQAGLGFSFSVVDPQMIDTVINSKWSGKNYSTRIWKNTRLLAQTVKEELLINLVTGRTNREAAQIIQNKFTVGVGVARRLIRTESNYLSGEINFKAYEEAGIEKYQFVAVLDLRTSMVCQSLDSKIFLVKDRVAGVNCNPMHPWCRSTTVSVVDESILSELTRRAKDPVTGELRYIPQTMTYQEWYDKYLKGRPEVELAEKQIKNRSSDRRQYRNYQKILGNDIPDTLDSFQEMKYNNIETWKYTKLAYTRQKKLIDHPELKLPNAEKAVLPEGKFTKYLFGGENEKGLAKGKAFTSRLGYDLENWEDLRREISANNVKYPASYKGKNNYGDIYEQKQILYGKHGKPANVITGWIVKPDGAVNLTSAYIKEVK